MRKKAEKTAALMLVLLLVLMTGCSGEEAASSEDPKASSPDDLGVMISGSASQGGANYLIMSGWAELIKKETGYAIRNESTGGPGANMQLMNEGQAKFGVLSGIVAREGFDGEGWTEGKKLDKVRAMFGLNRLLMDGIALANSGIKTIYDLDGKTISVGPAGGTPYILAKRVFKMLDIEPKIVELGQGDSVDALKNKQLDAVMFAGAYPRPAYVEIEANTPITFIEIPEEVVEKIVAEYPSFKEAAIPADTYKYLEKDNITLEDRYMYGTTADMPEEVVYKITKVTIEKFKEFQKVHKSLGEVDLQALGKVSIPLHPGAARALEEAGIEISDSAKPID